MLSHTPSLPEWLARKSLALTAEKVGDYDYSMWKEAGKWSYELGYGRVNAYQAVTYGASAVSDPDGQLNAVMETHTGRSILRFDESSAKEWQLLDMNGRVISNGTAVGSLQIDHESLSTGIYALRVLSGDNYDTYKLMVP
jgi:hypothetical protein